MKVTDRSSVAPVPLENEQTKTSTRPSPQTPPVAKTQRSGGQSRRDAFADTLPNQEAPDAKRKLRDSVPPRTGLRRDLSASRPPASAGTPPPASRAVPRNVSFAATASGAAEAAPSGAAPSGANFSGALSSEATPSGAGAPAANHLTFNTNDQALARARQSGLGRLAASEIPKHAAAYNKAAELTGVPAEMIAALHGNESQFGTYRASTHGPESGFGLDPRYVSTDWGNQKLQQHGLGSWERGTGSERSVLQSAVVAAEHFKRNAGYAGIDVDSTMNQKELAGAITSYMAGPGAGERAYNRGNSWMFDPSDSNPHPRHPGGTSIGPGGRTIHVPPSRKEGLLRWDSLLPLAQEQLGNTAPSGRPPQEMVNQAYNNLLHRQGDQAGVNYWTGVANDLRQQGKSDREIQNHLNEKFIQSPEYQQRFAEPTQNMVQQTYQNTLQREADPAGAQYWTDQAHQMRARGLSDAEIQQNIGEKFVQSPEYQQNIAPQNEQMVRQVYQDVLQRQGDTEGVNYWKGQTDQLRIQGKNNEEITQHLTDKFKASPEYEARFGGGSQPTGVSPTFDEIQQGKVMERGHSGQAVTELQDRLTQLGYGVAQTGEFGPTTEETLQKFQGEHQVQQTGKLGPTTLQALQQAEHASRPDYSALTNSVNGGKVLQPGDSGAAVVDLQRMLTQAGFGVQDTGVLGPTTEQKLKEFQAAHQVQQTGKVGPTTLQALQGAMRVDPLDTQGMTEAQKYDHFKRVIEAHGGQFKSGANERNILSLRHETDADVNYGRGRYDDVTVMLWQDSAGNKHVRTYPSNTEPSAQYRGRYGVDANGDGRIDPGRLPAGYYEYRRDYSSRLGNILSPTAPTQAERDTNWDGRFNDNAYAGAGYSMLFHSGSSNDTDSAGCQTMPPGEFNRFWNDLNSQGNPGNIGYTLVNL